MEKCEIIKLYSNNETILSISKKANMSRSGIYSILSKNGVKLHNKTPKSNILEINKDEVVGLYRNHVPVKSIAQKYGVPFQAVYNKLKKWNVRIPKQTCSVKNAELNKAIINNYLGGKSGIKIAKEVNKSPSYVYEILKKNQIPIRDKHKMNGLEVFEDFFEKIDCEEKAYWLGFLMADGYVLKPNKIGLALSVKDISHLEKFKKSIGSNAKIGQYETSGYSSAEYCRLMVFSNKMYFDLVSHGCCPNKTFVAAFPDINEELYRHFVRGYFDGDGSLYVSKTNSNIKICGTKEMLLSIIQCFNEQVNGFSFQYKLYQKKTMIGKNNYYLSFGGNNKTLAIAKWMYDNSNFFLDRKKEKFNLLKSMVEPIRNGGC